MDVGTVRIQFDLFLKTLVATGARKRLFVKMHGFHVELQIVAAKESLPAFVALEDIRAGVHAIYVRQQIVFARECPVTVDTLMHRELLVHTIHVSLQHTLPREQLTAKLALEHFTQRVYVI